MIGGDRDVFSPFLADVGALVMGGATYESALRDGNLLENPARWQQVHPDRPAWVFTHRDLPNVPGADITFVSGEVRPVHDVMVEAARGKNIWITGGGGLATAFADAGLLDELIVGVVPVMLASGKPLFTGRFTSSQLALTNVEHEGQVAYLTYRLSYAG